MDLIVEKYFTVPDPENPMGVITRLRDGKIAREVMRYVIHHLFKPFKLADLKANLTFSMSKDCILQTYTQKQLLI